MSMADRIRTLRRRSLAEVTDRSRQAITRWLELAGVGDVGEPGGARLRELIGSGDDGPVVRGPFFASLDDREATIAALQSVHPTFEATLRERADRVVAGHLSLLAHRDLTVGDPVDWWRDPVAGVRAPGSHWSRIRFLDPSVVGDHKVTWELGRHQALVLLAQAWWCTRESRYSSAIARLMEQWLAANPPKRGIHWASSLELALRGIAWTWVLALAGEVLPAVLRRRALAHLAVSARHIERYLSTWFSPNTHLTGEALGLFYLGTAFPQCPDAGRWRRRGATILIEWAGRHLRPDGSYVEQSSWYHRYTVDFLLHFSALAMRAQQPPGQEVIAPLQSALEYLAWMTRPDGSIPLIGDDDGGRLLFLDERTAHDARTPLAIGAAMLGRGDFAYLAGAASPELVWLIGPQGLQRYRALEVRPPVPLSRAFPDGGLHVIRTDWGRNGSVLSIDAGPHGFLNGGHAHADALGIDLALDGQPLVIDPGTFTYTLDPAWRDRFRDTAMHNAATVDGNGSASVAGPFRWRTRVEARCDAWFDGGDLVLFAGSHDGFARLDPAAAYARQVAYIAPGLWIIRDELFCGIERTLSVHWHGAPGLHCELADSAATWVGQGGPRAVMHAVGPGTWVLEESRVALTYGGMVSGQCLTRSARGRGSVVVTTILVSPGVTVEAREGPALPGRAALHVRWGDRTGVLVRGGASVGDVVLDAPLGWVRTDDAGVAIAASAAAPGSLSVGGRRIAAGNDHVVRWRRGDSRTRPWRRR